MECQVGGSKTLGHFFVWVIVMTDILLAFCVLLCCSGRFLFVCVCVGVRVCASVRECGIADIHTRFIEYNKIIYICVCMFFLYIQLVSPFFDKVE